MKEYNAESHVQIWHAKTHAGKRYTTTIPRAIADRLDITSKDVLQWTAITYDDGTIEGYAHFKFNEEDEE